MNGLETLVGSALIGAFGSPMVLGLVVLLVMIGAVAVLRLSLESAIVILVPTFLLVSATTVSSSTVFGLGLIGALEPIFLFALVVIVAIAILRLLHR